MRNTFSTLHHILLLTTVLENVDSEFGYISLGPTFLLPKQILYLQTHPVVQIDPREER